MSTLLYSPESTRLNQEISVNMPFPESESRRRIWTFSIAWVVANALGVSIGVWGGDVFAVLAARAVRAAFGGYHTVGGTMSIPGIAGHAVGILTGLIAGGAVFGATLGVVQWLVLRRRLYGMARWVVATAGGGAVAGALVAALASGVPGLVLFSVFAGLIGAVAGAYRWFALELHLRRPLWRLPVYALLGTLIGLVFGGVVCVVFMVAAGGGRVIAYWILVGAVVGALVGTTQSFILRQEFERAKQWTSICGLGGAISVALPVLVLEAAGRGRNVLESAQHSLVMGYTDQFIDALTIWSIGGIGGFAGGAIVGALGGAITAPSLSTLVNRPFGPYAVRRRRQPQLPLWFAWTALAFSAAAMAFLPLHYLLLGELVQPPNPPLEDLGSPQWQEQNDLFAEWVEQKVLRNFAWVVSAAGTGLFLLTSIWLIRTNAQRKSGRT